MATFDPYNEQIMGLREQQALAQKLRDQGLEMPQGQMVSGHFVAPATTQYLAQALKGYLGGQDVEAAKQGIKDLMAQRQAESQAFLENMPKATETQVEVRTPQTMNQMGPSPLSKALRVNPSPEDVLAYAAKAPGISPVDVGNLAVKGAELQAGREARLAERQMALEAENKRDRERAQDRLDQIKFAASMRPAPQEQPIAVINPNDPNGAPILVPKSQAMGMTPFNAQTGGASGLGARLRDATEAMGIIQQALPLINKSTSSGIGTNIDEANAYLFGGALPGAKAAASLKVLGGALVSKMPKMSGPQSDKDVMLYKEMAGRLGDSTVPASSKQEAMQTLYDLQAKYAGVPTQKLNFDNVPDKSSSILNQADAILGGSK
jgi:hypothetical protein